MTDAKIADLKQQGLLTYSLPSPTLRPFSLRDMDEHWAAMKTPNTPSYITQRRFAGTYRSGILDRAVRWVRRIKS